MKINALVGSGRTFVPCCFLIAVSVVFSAVDVRAAEVTITSAPLNATVVITETKQKCVTPCRLAFDNAYFDATGGNFLDSKRLLNPLTAVVSMEGYQGKQVQLTKGPIPKDYKDLKTVHVEYYYITGVMFHVALDELDYFQLGVQQLNRKQYAEAVQSFQAAIKKDPKNAQAFFNSYLAYAALGKYPDAGVMLGSAIALKPDNIDWKLLLADLNLQQKKDRDAAKLYEEVLSRRPSFDLAVKLGNLDLSFENWEAAEKAFAIAAKLNDSNLDVHLSLAHIYSKLSDENASLDEYKKILELQPGNGEAADKVGEAYLNNAKEQLKAKNFLEAIKGFGDAARLRPAVAAEALYLTIQAYESLGQYENILKASERLASLLQNKPDRSSEERIWLGFCYKVLGLYKRAADELREAVKTVQQAEPRLWLALSLELTDNHEASLKAADETVQMQPGLASAYTARCRAHYRLGHAQQTLDDCQRALALNPRDAEAEYYKGGAMEDLSMPAETATEAYKRCIADLNAARYLDAYEYFIRAKCREEMQDKNGAVADYLQVIKFQPQFAQALLNLGNAYIDLMRKDEALKYVALLEKIDPERAKILREGIEASEVK